MRTTLPRILTLIGGLAALAPGAATTADDPKPDLVVADFEGTTYGDGWQVEADDWGVTGTTMVESTAICLS